MARPWSLTLPVSSLPTRRQRIEDQRFRHAADVSGGVGVGD
jgi:hypothetical protein